MSTLTTFCFPDDDQPENNLTLLGEDLAKVYEYVCQCARRTARPYPNLVEWEDVAQQAISKLLLNERKEGAAKFDPARSNWKTWTSRVIYNSTMDQLRERKYHSQAGDSLEARVEEFGDSGTPAALTGDDPADLFEDKELIDLVMAKLGEALASITPVWRGHLLEVLQTPKHQNVKTVSSPSSRSQAYRQLRELLKPLLEDALDKKNDGEKTGEIILTTKTLEDLLVEKFPTLRPKTQKPA
jgi:DNA-directed RNA polymerase specialized sigma24 family protein